MNFTNKKVYTKVVIMSIFILFLFSISSIAINATDPKTTPIKSYVNDYANMISDKHQQQISELFENLYLSNQAQAALVTINELGNMHTVETYAMQLSHENLGDTKKDNGVLILISKNDKKFRIEVGYGLEHILTDAISSKILRDASKYFKSLDYSSGAYFISNEIYSILSNETYAKKYSSSQVDKQKKENIAKIFNLVLFLIILSTIFGKNKGRKDDNFFLAAMLGSSLLRNNNFGGGGGFGGFGGGGFGGGGGSGGW